MTQCDFDPLRPPVDMEKYRQTEEESLDALVAQLDREDARLPVPEYAIDDARETTVSRLPIAAKIDRLRSILRSIDTSLRRVRVLALEAQP